MNEKIYLAALHKIWFSHKFFFENFKKIDSYKDFYENINYSLLKNYNFSDKKILKIIENKNKINFSDLNKKIDNLKVKIITFFDTDYPENLRHIFNPPFLFYLRWSISEKNISFIWSRAISIYWKKIIEKFVPEIGQYFCIVSGWASWCDSYSHIISLENNIKTISVLWTWIDITYPAGNFSLYNNIVASGGWIISIFPFWEPWNPYNFPIRNEVVAGLSVWVFIVEAKEKSWTMITSKLALDLWKDVFCVPGDIFKSGSSWCNKLIANWEAKFVTKVSDVLEEYNINTKNKQKIQKPEIIDEIEKNIFDLLFWEALNIDEIKNKLWLDINTVLFKISMLEIYWYIKKSEYWSYEIN